MTWIFVVGFLCYLAVSVWTVVNYVEPWTKGDIETRVGADSDRYWAVVQTVHDEHSLKSLVNVTGNYLGPTLIGFVFSDSFGVMFFNIMLFCASLAVVSSIPRANAALVGVLLMLNAELLPSLTTLNKEILALFAMALTAKYLSLNARPLWLLSAIIAVCILARWEQAAILLIALAVFRISKPRPWWGIVGVIAVITVGYPFAFRLLGVDPEIFNWLLVGGNTILLLNKVQNAFGFALVVIPKIIMLTAGKLILPAFYTANDLSQGLSDPQQQIFQPLGCAAYILIFTWAWLKGKLRPSSPTGFLALITLIVTAASPFIQPRYLFSTYVLMCVELATTAPPGMDIPPSGGPDTPRENSSSVEAHINSDELR